MLLSLFLACWTDFSKLPTLDIQELEFDNEHLAVNNVRVRMFDSHLRCPDGEKASFFMVYPVSSSAIPISIIFHSGALDYADEIAEGEEFIADGRLTNNWASARIWETLNLTHQSLNTGVNDLGTLPTALANSGVAQLYPSNCWGDYWHNGITRNPNNSIAEGYSRQGFDMAKLMVYLLDEQQLQSDSSITADEKDTIKAIAAEMSATIDQPLDTSKIYWIGMGSGGQAMIELLLANKTPPSAAIFDSAPATLTPYLDNPDFFDFENTAFSRIFQARELSDFALDATVSLPERTAWLWSNGDSQHPQSVLKPGLDTVASLSEAWTEDINQTGHVFLNQDIELANRAVQYLITGSADIANTDNTNAQ